jgi:N-acetylglucosaminyldiphosphoundecaprenol N-acetyl-beta-D-mannosaminyltransferase
MFLVTSMLVAAKRKPCTQSNTEANISESDHALSANTLNQYNISRVNSLLDETKVCSPSSRCLDFCFNTNLAENSLPFCNVIGSPITALPFDAQMNIIVEWAQQHLSKMVCVANAHMLVEAHWNPDFAQILQEADIVTSDGMPIVWMMKRLGIRTQNRVAGMDILMSLCHLATQYGLKVYFLGSQQSVLDRMKARLDIDFPSLSVAGIEPLPFRPMTLEEEDDVLNRIQASGAGLVFVSLGCPKQEKWMAQYRSRVPAVMIGLGGAFPVYGGLKKWAPRWIQKAGLEWAYRWMQEPRRLAKRYSQTNRAFLWLSLKQLFQAGVQHIFKR